MRGATREYHCGPGGKTSFELPVGMAGGGIAGAEDVEGASTFAFAFSFFFSVFSTGLGSSLRFVSFFEGFFGEGAFSFCFGLGSLPSFKSLRNCETSEVKADYCEVRKG